MDLSIKFRKRFEKIWNTLCTGLHVHIGYYTKLTDRFDPITYLLSTRLDLCCCGFFFCRVRDFHLPQGSFGGDGLGRDGSNYLDGLWSRCHSRWGNATSQTWRPTLQKFRFFSSKIKSKETIIRCSFSIERIWNNQIDVNRLIKDRDQLKRYFIMSDTVVHSFQLRYAMPSWGQWFQNLEESTHIWCIPLVKWINASDQFLPFSLIG